MSVRAHVTLPDLTPQESHEVRDRVLAWAAVRPHLEQPEVWHLAWPKPGQDPAATFFALDRCCAIQLVDPTPEDLLSLADLIGPWAWPATPRLTWTSDPEQETMQA